MSESGFLGRISGPFLSAVGRRLDLVSRLLDAGVVPERATPAKVEEAEAIFLRARMLVRTGNLREALPLFERAHALAPSFTDVIEGWGEVLDQAGQGERAMSMYDSHRRLRAAARRPMPDRNFVLRRGSRLVAEIAEYSWLLRGLSSRPFPYIARGNANLAMGLPWRAVVDYIAALGCDPNLVEAIALKGEALSMMGRYDEARRAFDEALEKKTDDLDALNGRAIVHMACGRVAEADSDWRRQLLLLPSERASARACVALRLADYAVARPELDRALEREPDDPYWHLYRLTAARRVGEPFVAFPPRASVAWPAPLVELHAGRMSADEALERADNPGRQSEAHFQLGILALTRDLHKARSHFQHVVEVSPPTQIEHAAARHELLRWAI